MLNNIKTYQGDNINGLTTVNGGVLVDTPFGIAEIIGPGITSHRTKCVCVYAAEGNRKIMLVYSGENCVAYRYKNHTELHHYWSRAFSTEALLQSRKYKYMIEAAIQISRLVF